MKNNFIFFGCWNDGYCDINKPDNNGVSSVFHHLLNAPNPTFYVVGAGSADINKIHSFDSIAFMQSFIVCLFRAHCASAALQRLGEHDAATFFKTG